VYYAHPEENPLPFSAYGPEILETTHDCLTSIALTEDTLIWKCFVIGATVSSHSSLSVPLRLLQDTSSSLIGSEYSDCNVHQNIGKASEQGIAKPPNLSYALDTGIVNLITV
jgi:hypothetical protein